MPARIILSSGELVVREPYAAACQEIFDAGNATWEATALHLCNVDDADYDEDAPKPVYSESLITVRCSAVVAIEREEQWLVDIIDRARQQLAE